MNKKTLMWVRIIIYVYVFTSVLAAFLLWVDLFLLAYQNPAKRATIDINAKGEANIELIMVVFTVGLLPYSLYKLYTVLKKPFIDAVKG